MATIRYLAFLCEEPAALANFYCRYLGAEEVGRSATGDVALTDGFYKLAFFRKRPGLQEPRTEVGLNHIGLEVDSLEEVKRRYLTFNPRGTVIAEPGDALYGEIRIHDPDGNPVSLSANGFGIPRARRLPGIRHVAYNTHDPEGMLQFYGAVFGLREVMTSYTYRRDGRLNRFAGDGFTNLAIHPFYNAGSPGHEMRFGINHIGFLVSDLQAAMADLRDAVTIEPRPPDRPYAEVRFKDPEGNRLDLSQGKGWELDVAVWERGA